MRETRSILNTENGSFWLLIFVLCVLSTGCASFRSNRRAAVHRVQAKRHDTELAKSLHEKALTAMEKNNWPKAKEWANKSVLADSDFGPAHNTLGSLYFRKDELYHAAWEFEEASKLMPENCEPLNNLGLVYEKAGKYEEAYSYYQEGLELAPGNIELSGNVARVRIILDDRGDDLEKLLCDLALTHPQKRWRSWARTQSEVRRFDEAETWEHFNQQEQLPETVPIEVQQLDDGGHFDHQEQLLETVPSEVQRFDNDGRFDQRNQLPETIWVPPTTGEISETPTIGGETNPFGAPVSELEGIPSQPPPLEIGNGVSSRINRSN